MPKIECLLFLLVQRKAKYVTSFYKSDPFERKERVNRNKDPKTILTKNVFYNGFKILRAFRVDKTAKNWGGLDNHQTKKKKIPITLSNTLACFYE